MCTDYLLAGEPAVPAVEQVRRGLPPGRRSSGHLWRLRQVGSQSLTMKKSLHHMSPLFCMYSILVAGIVILCVDNEYFVFGMAKDMHPSRGVPRGDAQDARASPPSPLCIPPSPLCIPPPPCASPLPSLKGWL
jgi:hypothetical protein